MVYFRYCVFLHCNISAIWKVLIVKSKSLNSEFFTQICYADFDFIEKYRWRISLMSLCWPNANIRPLWKYTPSFTYSNLTKLHKRSARDTHVLFCVKLTNQNNSPLGNVLLIWKGRIGIIPYSISFYSIEGCNHEIIIDACLILLTAKLLT